MFPWLIAVVFLASSTFAKSLVLVEEALKSIYPGCAARTETRYLSAEQVKEASRLAGTAVSSAVVTRYSMKCASKGGVGGSSGGPAGAGPGGAAASGGYAYTDTHRVRTHPETLLIALDGEGRVLRVEVLSFDEPVEYMPNGPWYKLFGKQRLDSELALKRAIPLVTGASLTSRATTDATRRALALHEVLGK